jgi:NAD(P)-dependent dehydrogenase (short-subunit alcohol dehydrogenase family)
VLCCRFVAEGWQVAALDRADADVAGALASGSTSPTAAVAAAIERVVAELGAPKAVVNAAGVYPPSTLQTATTELYRRTFDVNVLGTLLVTQAVAPSLVEGAAVVNFASIDAFVPSPGQLLYCASKAEVVALTRSLALELGPHVRVSALAPGPGRHAHQSRHGAHGGRPRLGPTGACRHPGGDGRPRLVPRRRGACRLRHGRDADRDRRQRLPMIPGRLDGRVAIITGGARGQARRTSNASPAKARP